MVGARMDLVQEVEYADGNRDDQRCDENGILYGRDNVNLSGRAKDVRAAQDIVSMLQCLLVEKKKRRGLIGFDQCGEKRVWTLEEINVLSMVSGVVGVFLSRQRLEQTMEILLRS